MKKLNYKHLEIRNLNEGTLESMFLLMQENYNSITKDQFFKDLSSKQFVGMLYDENNIVRGFTTYVVNLNNSGTDEYSVLFSGDTIISPEYWGTIELIRGWCFSVAQMIKSDPNKTWYWFLLSKGHRTFMYLPLFFENYYPQQDGKSIEQSELFELLEILATKIYPEIYIKGSGIIQFPYEGGELKESLAQGTFEKAKKKSVQWFLEKNPNFYKGDELICLTKIDPQNMRGIGKRIFDSTFTMT